MALAISAPSYIRATACDPICDHTGRYTSVRPGFQVLARSAEIQKPGKYRGLRVVGRQRLELWTRGLKVSTKTIQNNASQHEKARRHWVFSTWLRLFALA